MRRADLKHCRFLPDTREELNRISETRENRILDILLRVLKVWDQVHMT